MGWLALASVPAADPPAEPGACSGCHPASGPSARPVKESESRRAVRWLQMLLVRGIPEAKSKEKACQGAWASENHQLPDFCPTCCSRADDTTKSQGKWQEKDRTWLARGFNSTILSLSLFPGLMMMMHPANICPETPLHSSVYCECFFPSTSPSLHHPWL